MPTLKFWDSTRGEYVPIGTTGGSGGGVNPEDIPNEVLVDATGVAPTDPETELWVDEADPGTPQVSVLNDLADVDTVTTPPVINDNMAWNGTVWAPKAAAGATLDSLTDVDAPAPTVGDFLKWNGSAWVPESGVAKVTVSSVAPSLPDLGDIWITP